LKTSPGSTGLRVAPDVAAGEARVTPSSSSTSAPTRRTMSSRDPPTHRVHEHAAAAIVRARKP
jgi:hypothetical protein